LYYKNKLQIAGFISFPIAQIKIAKYVTFLPISHQIRFCTTMVEFWHRKFFRHYNEMFVEISMSCAIFSSFGQLDFPSFSGHFE
ncbi:hypothetical protein T09_8736, partial [Trichinella sp. T9]